MSETTYRLEESLDLKLLKHGPPMLPGAVSVVQNKSDAHNAAGGDHLRAQKYLNLLASCAQNIRG